MADPVIVACAADTWVKIATGVIYGQVWIKDFTPNRYLQAHVDTTNPAPVDNTKAVAFIGITMSIRADVAIDVYLKAVGAAGSVRVDL